MNRHNLQIFTGLVLALVLVFSLCTSALAYQKDTLYSGVRSEAVKELQTALITLGYLGGTPDGIYGTHTELAVKAFQKKNGLKADGVAGAKTQTLIYQKAGKTSGSSASGSGSSAGSSSSSSGASSASSSSKSSESSSSKSSDSSSSKVSSSGIFGGNYATMRVGSTGSRVTALQKRLIALGYLSGGADGIFGKATKAAVVSFQKASGLTADGLAGKKTLLALESTGAAAASSDSSKSSSSGTSSDSGKSSSGNADPSSGKTASGPSGSQVKLLHWYNDVKPTLRSGQTLYIYEPSSGQGWNLRIYSCGRHCDAEPCTAEDTASMLKAFGGQNTWSQKAVYVKLPGGTWTIGSTHDMPHMSGSVKDNNFNGHLCVHFLRTMSEAREKDPNYGVSNQETIRAFWKSLTGEEITD